jgi:hypothetical protein
MAISRRGVRRVRGTHFDSAQEAPSTGGVFHVPIDAPERRDGALVMADAAVIVWDERDPAVRRILALVEAKGIPVHVIGAPVKQKVKRVRGPAALEPRRRGRLPN